MTDREPKKDFNQGAVAVPPLEIEAFLKELGNNMCAVAVRYDNGHAADMASINDILSRLGGHVVTHSPGKHGGGDHVNMWTGAVGIGAVQKLPHVRFVQPYRNWSDPRNPPLSQFNRGLP